MNKIYQKIILNRKIRAKCKNAGFTLIELLVVVLIIGILAAVALPQYERAIAKAKVAKVLPWFKKLEEGREMYLMNGGRSTCLDLSRYLDAAGVSYYRFRCVGASEDGPCDEVNGGWCAGTLYIDDKTQIFSLGSFAAYSYQGPAKSKGLTDFQLLLRVLGGTDDRLFCKPRTEWGHKMCLQMASSPEIKNCVTEGECDSMSF